MKQNTIKKIKENINEKEYKRLMNYVRGNDSFREYKKMNLLRSFCLLYFCGLRINELRSITFGQIYDLLDNQIVIIYSSKTNIEKKIYLTEIFRKELIKLFSIKEERGELVIYNDRRVESKNSNIGFINTINNVIKEVLGDRYTSHSFRRGLITEMGSRGINLKIISKFIGHSDIKTTMRYIQPTDEDIRNCLIR